MKRGKDRRTMEDPLEEVSKEMRADGIKYTAPRMSLHQQKVNFFCIRTNMMRVGSDKQVGGREG